MKSEIPEEIISAAVAATIIAMNLPSPLRPLTPRTFLSSPEFLSIE